jgi:hypothetical protein
VALIEFETRVRNSCKRACFYSFLFLDVTVCCNLIVAKTACDVLRKSFSLQCKFGYVAKFFLLRK